MGVLVQELVPLFSKCVSADLGFVHLSFVIVASFSSSSFFKRIQRAVEPRFIEVGHSLLRACIITDNMGVIVIMAGLPEDG